MHRHTADVPSARSAHGLACDGGQERRLLGARSLLHTDDCRELHRPRHPAGQGVEVVRRLMSVPSSGGCWGTRHLRHLSQFTAVVLEAL